jgi:LysR family hydrogen peroxide-inducible transcriptional activator
VQIPTLRQLEYIVAVAEEGHFGRAALRCAVSQPALSKQIAEAEGLLGVRLFERSRPQVRVTVEGVQLIEQARRVLMEARELAHVVQTARGEAVGAIQLGCIPTLAPYVLPGLMSGLREATPGLKVGLVEAKTDALLQGLRAGRLDVLLLALPVDGTDGLEVEPVWEDPFVLALPQGHPLEEDGSAAELDVLKGWELLLMEEGHCFRSHALDVCTTASGKVSVIAASSMTTLVLMVEQGMGATLLPQSALEVELGRAQGVVVRAFRAPAPRRSVGLCWRSGSALTEIIKALRAALLSRPRPGSGHLSRGALAHPLADPIYRAGAGAT